MNVKKMFASLTGVLMLASTLPVSVLGAASYSDELKSAYEYAYSKNITTMSSIDNANMYGELTRGQLAKMIANWAEKEMGTKVDETAVCSFSDANTAEGDLATYVKKACQMGLMGQGIEKFRPNDKVTRGEFGTTLSRALWGDKYNGATPFYKNHLEALKEAGIMKMIETPNQMEIRGYVMLMLMRATDVVSPAECKDPTVVLACSLNSDACPAKCKKENTETNTGVVKAGDLVITATAAPDRKVIVSGAVSDLDTISFKADQDITVEKVVLERYGYSSTSDIDAVWLEDGEGVKIAEERGLTSKDEVTLNIKKDSKNFGKSAVATIVVRTTTGAKVGGTLGFKVKEVVSSAKNTNLSNYTPYTYDMVDYSAANVTLAAKGNDKNYNYSSSESYEVARFQVKAAEAALEVNGFTLTNTGTLDVEKFLKKVEVTANGKAVNGVKYSVNKDDQLVISFDKMELALREKVTFIVNIALQDFDDYGKTVWYSVKESGDFKAVEKKTGARVTVKVDGTWAKHEFMGGKIKITNTKLGTVDAAQGSTDVVIAEGNIEIAEPIKTSFTVGITSDNAKDIDAMTLIVGNDEFDGKKNGASFQFNNVVLEKSGKVQFKVDIHSDAKEAQTIEFKIGNKAVFGKDAFVGAKYDENNELVNTDNVGGSVTLEKVKVQPAKASLENNLTKDVEFLANENSRKVVFDGTYTAKKGAVTLKSFSVTGAKVLSNPDQITFYVSVDGNEIGETDNIAEEENFSSDVKVEAGKSVKVKVEAEVYATGKVAGMDYKLILKGEDDNQNEAGIASDDLATIKVVENGSVTVSNPAGKDTVLKKQKNAVIAQFVVKPSNGVEGLTLDEVTLSGTAGTTALTADDLRVKIDGEEKDGTASSTGLHYESNDTLPVAGITVEVVLKNELTGDVVLELKSVNNKSQTRTFTKRFEEALVSIKSQENKGDETKFVLGVELADSDTEVSNVKLFVGNAMSPTNANIAGVFADGDDVATINGADAAQYVTKITYDYKLSDGATGSVTIEKSKYNDYFKVGSDYAKVFKAKD